MVEGFQNSVSVGYFDITPWWRCWWQC